VPVSYEDSRPTYLQVAEVIRGEITGGQVGPGERLPSVRDLSARFDIAAVTVQSALRVLRDEGYIASRSTRGYFVRDELPEEEPAVPSPEFLALRHQIDSIRATVDELATRVSQLESTVREADDPAPPSSLAPERGD